MAACLFLVDVANFSPGPIYICASAAVIITASSKLARRVKQEANGLSLARDVIILVGRRQTIYGLWAGN